MTRRQFGFLMGFLTVWLAAAQTWVVLAALAGGAIVYAVVLVLEGSLDLGEFSERFRSGPRR